MVRQLSARYEDNTPRVATDLIEQGAAEFEAAVPMLSQLLSYFLSARKATQSTSTLQSTIMCDCTQARAGGFSPKYSA